MKKYISLFIVTSLLVSCGWGNPERTKDGTSNNYMTEASSCNDRMLEDCESLEKSETINEVLQINDTVCNLGSNISAGKYNEIFSNYNEKQDLIFDLELTEDENEVKTISFSLDKKNIDAETQGKTVNIMFDLTYFSGNESVETDVFVSREKSLEQIIKNGIGDFEINYGDTINIFYIGTSDYGEGKNNYAITDVDSFIFKKEGSSLSGKYSISYVCEKNQRKRTLSLYYFSQGKDALEEKTTDMGTKYVSTLDDLEAQVLATIEEKYNTGMYSRGTYLLESLSKNTKFLQEPDSINVLISDMFFQLHPTMRTNKDIRWDGFDFSRENILKLKSDTNYKDFYETVIPQYVEDKCQNGEQLYIIGVELSDDLDLKKVMKDYYKNIFFKNCSVAFNS